MLQEKNDYDYIHYSGLFFFTLTLELWISKQVVRLLLGADDPLRGLYLVGK